jgi:hypothetical protein
MHSPFIHKARLQEAVQVRCLTCERRCLLADGQVGSSPGSPQHLQAWPGYNMPHDSPLHPHGQACLPIHIGMHQDRCILAGRYWVTNSSCTFLSLPRLILGHDKT